MIKEIIDKKEKSTITNTILRNLPKWFGIEESILEYVDGVKESLFLVFNYGEDVGFISIKIHNKYTAEIYVIGVLEKYHRYKIGSKLLKEVENRLRDMNIKYLIVKTLGESHPDINYKKTRLFYEGLNFHPLEEISEIWGKENPCLIMIKNI